MPLLYKVVSLFDVSINIQMAAPFSRVMVRGKYTGRSIRVGYHLEVLVLVLVSFQKVPYRYHFIP